MSQKNVEIVRQAVAARARLKCAPAWIAGTVHAHG
jgi:hypothetical protein